MRQTVLVILLVLIVVLSAHFAQMTRANLQMERVMHDTSLLAAETDGRIDDEDDDGRPVVYHDAVAAAKD